MVSPRLSAAQCVRRYESNTGWPRFAVYSRGELVAELAAAMVSATVGIESPNLLGKRNSPTSRMASGPVFSWLSAIYLHIGGRIERSTAILQDFRRKETTDHEEPQLELDR